MKRLKSYKSIFESLTQFEEDKSYLEDVLQTLRDRGFNFSINQKLSSSKLRVFSKPCLLILPPSWENIEGFTFRDVEDEVKHIISYLGDRIVMTGAVFIGDPNRHAIDPKLNFKYLDDKIYPNKLSELAIFFDSHNTIEERYQYIDKLELNEFEDGLAEIEKTFLEIPKDEILDIVTEFENFSKSPIERGDLRPLLWQSDVDIVKKRISTSFDQTLFYYETEDFYKMSSQSIQSRRGIKFIESETLETFFRIKTEAEIEYLLGFDVVKSHFTTSIKDEAKGFSSMIQSGWMPCLAMCNLKFLKNWQQSTEKIDLLFSITERLDEFLDYQMVFLPKSEEPSIIFIHKKYIKNI